ncbi:MAG: hypothetical protein ACHQXK_09080 [Methanosarcina thermophila]
MIVGTKFRAYTFLVVALLMNTLILPGTALATDSSSDILENISYDKDSLRFAEILDNFETVTSNPDVFLNDVADGKVKLKLLGKEFDLELENTHILSDDAKVFIENETGTYIIPAAKINTYRGKVIGEENSSAGFAVSDEVVIGQIEIENICYAIELTNKTVDGKVVLVVYSSDDVKKHENEEFVYCGVEEQPSLNGTFPINSHEADYNSSNSIEYETDSSNRKSILDNIKNSNVKENIHVADLENNTINGSTQKLPFRGFVLAIIAITTIALTFEKRKNK